MAEFKAPDGTLLDKVRRRIEDLKPMDRASVDYWKWYDNRCMFEPDMMGDYRNGKWKSGSMLRDMEAQDLSNMIRADEDAYAMFPSRKLRKRIDRNKVILGHMRGDYLPERTMMDED